MKKHIIILTDLKKRLQYKFKTMRSSMQQNQNTPKPKNRRRIPFESKINNKKRYEFIYSSAISPHPEKIDKGGQDAVFVSKNVLVVADGVGSWKDWGVDPGIYSKKLIENVSNLIQQDEKRNYYIDNPQQLACAVVNLTKAQGSSTLSIITLHPTTGMVRTYHIGDSVYGIFHPTGDYIIGMQQQYIFNHPYQVGSNFIHRDSNQQMQFSKPQMGIYNQFDFNQIKDSHIMLASDGIWDNLFPLQIHKVLIESKSLKQQHQMPFPDQQYSLNYTVNKMINLTKTTYMIKDYQSPFFIKGKQAGLNVGKFAKVDDLSLIVAKVVEQQIQQIMNS